VDGDRFLDHDTREIEPRRRVAAIGVEDSIQLGPLDLVVERVVGVADGGGPVDVGGPDAAVQPSEEQEEESEDGGAQQEGAEESAIDGGSGMMVHDVISVLWLRVGWR
jgi:hypothetical protein